MTIAQLERAVGGLSKPSKMPGHAWSTPAEKCRLGALLRQRDGSVCSGCYALKGRYVFPNVQNALHRRLEIYESDPGAWVENMATLINARSERERWFRWHDSGDLQSPEHLGHICEIARRTPRRQDTGYRPESGQWSEPISTVAEPSPTT